MIKIIEEFRLDLIIIRIKDNLKGIKISLLIKALLWELNINVTPSKITSLKIIKKELIRSKHLILKLYV